MKLWGGVAESADDRRLLLVIAESAEKAMNLVGDALTARGSLIQVDIGDQPICEMQGAVPRVFAEVSLPAR